MIELTREVDIPAAPQQVWNALVDFSGYSRWNPYVRMRGTAAMGSEIEWSLGSTVLKRRIWSEGRVLEWDRPNILAWAVGSRRLFLVEERFALERIPQGTRLQHRVRVSGLPVSLAKPLLRKRLTVIVSTIDDSLRRYFARPSAPSRAPSGPAHVGGGHARKSRHKTRRRTK